MKDRNLFGLTAGRIYICVSDNRNERAVCTSATPTDVILTFNKSGNQITLTAQSDITVTKHATPTSAGVITFMP